MGQKLHRSLLVLSFTTIACSSHAVLGALLSTPSPWTNVGMVLTSGGNGSGVPISSRWILTAGHVVRSSSTGAVTNPATTNFRLGSLASGTNYGIDQIVPHPTDDLAAIHTTTDLPGFFGITLSTVPNQSQIDIVGYGLTATYNAGTGQWSSVSGSYGTLRRGQNVVSNTADLGQTTGFNRWRFMYRYDFDGNGVDTFGDGGPIPGGDALGFSGDSGGGLFVNGSVIGLHLGRPSGSIQWGTVAVASQLSAYSQFIVSTTGVPEPATMLAIGTGIAAMAFRRRKKA